MKKSFYILLTVVFLSACSTRKNNFLSRSYHNVTTKYNILYNGNLKLTEGINELNSNFSDNFWELLPIEPLKINEEKIELKAQKGESKDNETAFDIAEEKAVKAVQKHSIYVAGSEKNKQIDDAYLLLGQARYYSQRFVPALEAFDYSIKNNPKSELIDQFRIWKAKTLLRLQNEESALNELQLIEKNKNLKKEDQVNFHTIYAMTYLALDSIAQAKNHLLKTLDSKIDPDQKARNWFILGQLYKNENRVDSAQWAFNNVIENKKNPLKYVTHAYFQEIELTDDATLLSEYKNKLKKLSNDPYNSQFKDEILYYLAEIDFKQKNETDAIINLHNSIKVPNAKNFQKILSYEKLGDFYFNKNDFVKAAQFYDSVRPFVENANTKHIKKLERKIKNLEEVVFFENQIKNNDSILNLVAMSDSDRKLFFEKYIDQLKKEDKKIANKIENTERNQVGATTGEKFNKKEPNAKWYFYNAQTVAYGKQEFLRIWGKIELKDNWRWSDDNSIVDNSFDNTEKKFNGSTKTNKENPRYTVDTYISNIPTKAEDIQKLKNEKSDALYQLGLIYKEKFQVYPLAKDRLEIFLQNEPKEKLVLPAKFHLQKVYEKLGDNKATELKSEIIKNYADSRYAAMLLNKTVFELDSVKTPEQRYEDVFCEYEYENYKEVITQCDEAIKLYADEPIQPKFELLKSYAVYHTNGKEKFVENLEFVVLNFPKTEEAIHAQDVLDRLNGVIKEKSDHSIKENEFNAEQPKSLEKNKERIQPMNEEDKKQKVLQMMKEKGGPNMEDKKEKG